MNNNDDNQNNNNIIIADDSNDNSYTLDDMMNMEWEIHKFGGTSVASSECFKRCASIIEDQILGLKRHVIGNNTTDNTDSSFIDCDGSSNDNQHRNSFNNLSNIANSTGNETTNVNNSNSNNNNENKKNKKNKKIAIVVSAMGGKPKTTDLLLSLVKAASERNESKIQETLNFVISKHYKCIDELNLYNNNKDRAEKEAVKQNIKKNINDIKDILKTVSLLKWEAKRIAELVAGYGEIWSTQILCRLLNCRMENRRRLMNINNYEDNNDPVFVFIDAR